MQLKKKFFKETSTILFQYNGEYYEDEDLKGKKYYLYQISQNFRH